jgi:GntR family transcriptional regulator
MAGDIEIIIGSPSPIYRQIVDQVRLGVLTGKFTLGEQLPSVRTLAEKLVVNPNTIARAYGDLVREGVLESRHGQGVFIAARRSVFSDDERERRLAQAVDALISEAVGLQCSADEIRTAVETRLKDLGLSNRKKRG